VTGACNLTDGAEVTVDGYSGEVLIHELLTENLGR
jgi:hypothetical protein